MGYFKWADRQLQDLLAKNPTYQRSKFPGQQLGLANQLLTSQMPGTQQFTNNIMSAGQTGFNNAAKYATDASQLLGVGAGLQGQTDQALGDLQTKQADWKKFGLQNLNEAYAANTAEDQYMNQLDQQRYQNEVSLRGAQAANKFAKRKALWNTVTGIANFGLNAAGMFVGKPPTPNMGASAAALGGGGY